MSMESEKKTVIITGSSRGIGKAIALKFAKEKYNVVINYLSNEEKALETSKQVKELGGNPLVIKGDVRKKADVNHMVEETLKKFGNIDVMINNAGTGQIKMFTDIEEEEWDDMINVHLKGNYYTSKAVLPTMISNKSGSIINISSMWGQVGASCEVHYSAAKAGMIGMTKALAKELGPSNVRVNAVAPGVVMTDILKNIDENILKELAEETPLMRNGKPEDIANMAFYLASDEASFITGQVFGVSGGLII